MGASGLDLDWITPQIALGGCLPDASAQVLQALGVKAVIDMRSEAQDDAKSLALAGIQHLGLPTPDLEAVTAAMLDAGADFAGRILAAGGRVLIHCQHGIGRAPSLVLAVLVGQGRTPREALLLIKAKRDKVSPSPAQFDGLDDWFVQRGLGPRLDFATFAQIAYRRLPHLERS